jgi:hypothetical protein
MPENTEVATLGLAWNFSLCFQDGSNHIDLIIVAQQLLNQSSSNITLELWRQSNSLQIIGRKATFKLKTTLK